MEVDQTRPRLARLLGDLPGAEFERVARLPRELGPEAAETLKALPNTRPLLDVTPDTTAVDHEED
jgi:hypothetical protein